MISHVKKKSMKQIQNKEEKKRVSHRKKITLRYNWVDGSQNAL
jgi:hypothetical protein